MSECTDVNNSLAKNAGDRRDFKRLVLLIEWHLRCLKQTIEKSRKQFPATQEEILFKEIKNQVQTLKSDLLQLDIKNLKLIAIGLFDYEVGENANFNKFLVESLLSCCISMSEEIPKIREDEKIREKLNRWLQYIKDVKTDNRIQFHLDPTDPDLKAKIDRYLNTRRDVESLSKIHYNIESSKEIFEGNTIPIEEKVLALQRTFHVTGENLKDTHNTANLSPDVRQSLEKSGIPTKRLSKYRDTLAHNQLFPLIETDNNQVKQLYDDFLIMKKGIKTKIMKMEYSFIEKIIEESKIRGPVVKELTQLIRKKGFQGLEQRISKIKLRPEHISQSDQSKLDYIFQNVRHLRSQAFRESLAEVSDGELSTTYLDSITEHISQSMLNLYDKLRDEVATSLESYVGNLQNVHDDVLRQQQVIDLLIYKGTSPPNMSILDNLLSQPILEKVMVKYNRPLKQELGLYFDAESFKNNVNYATFKDSYPKKLIYLLKNTIPKPDDNTRKLITFLESKDSNINTPDIPPEEYERLVEDLPTNSYKTKEKLLLYSVEWRKKKCVDLLEKNFPAVKAIYDNILEGKLTRVSAYNELARQYELPEETEIALKQRAETLNDYIQKLYSKRILEEWDVLRELNNIYAVESEIINVYSLYEKSKPGGDSYDIRRFRNYLSHGDPLVSIEEHNTKIANRIVNITKEFVSKLTGPLTPQKIKRVLDNINSSFGIKDIAELICPASQSGRPPRHASESCLTWEEIDKFSEGGAENRDPDNIIIDSEKFISIISSDLEANEEKFSNFVALASESEVVGDHASKVNMLTDNHRYNGHLERVGKISGMVMHGMIAKNLVSDLLRGDYKDVAINLGFLAAGPVLEKIAQAAAMQGAESILKGSKLLGKSLKFASPLIARGVTGFIAWDLFTQVKEYEKGNKDALVSIIGDSVQIATDVAEIGIEIAEGFEVLEGVSAATGPIGMAVAAVIFVGTDIYMAVRAVEKIDEYIHLTGWEKFTEGSRAIFGLGYSYDIELQIEEKDANNQGVRNAKTFLKRNPHIRRYAFPSAEAYTIYEESERSCDSFFGIALIIGCLLLPPKKLPHTYARNVLNNQVLLDEKRYDIKWGRTKPDNLEGIDYFCLPMGDWESVQDGTTYYCKGAIGVEYANERTGNDTVISIGDGDDQVMGFRGSNNIIIFGDGFKRMTGGDKNDNFILGGKSDDAVYDSEIFAFIDGRGGIDRIDVSELAPHYKESKGVGRYQVTADFRKGVVKDTSKVSLHIENINEFLGRKSGVDHVVLACDTKHVDGKGGENKYYLDSITIPKDDDCSYDTKIAVNPYTRVTNNAITGNFVYFVKGKVGKEAYIELDPSSQSNNTFIFNYTLTDVAAIDKSEKNIIFSFVEGFYKREEKINVNKSFKLTVSGAPKNTTTYYLIDRTKIVMGQNNIYAMQNTEKPIDSLVKDYSSVADKLQMYAIVHSNDEVLTVGHCNGDVLMNDSKARTSHIVGGGGENVFVISSGHETITLAKLPISNVIIYDLDKENKIDTLDLREIKEQLKNDIGREINIELSGFQNDLLINLSLDDISNKEVVKIRLKGALENNWYNRVHIVIDSIFVIKKILDNFELIPQPLILDDNSKTIYVINPTDVAEGGTVRVKMEIGDSTFARDNDALVITNSLRSSVDKNSLYTIILNDFYHGNNQDKMQSLKIEFNDQKMYLRKEIERVNSAGNFNELKRKVRIDSYKAVMYAIKKQTLFEAIEGNNIGEVKELIDHGVSIDVRNIDGQTPLHSAAKSGNLEVVKYLIEKKGADVNVKDDSGQQPLHYAVINSNVEVIKYLVEERGVNVNAEDGSHRVALHLATEYNRLQVVKYLIEEKGADVNVMPNLGTVSMKLIVKYNTMKIKYIIEEEGAVVDVGDLYQKVPLHYAAKVGSLEMVKYLIEERGADINAADCFDVVPLHLAAEYNRLEVVKYLIEEKGVDVNVRDGYSKVPLHFAANGGRLEVVKYLIEEKGADTNVRDDYSQVPLHFAANGGRLKVVKYLIEEKGVDAEERDESKRVPLHVAAQYNRLEVVKYLIEEKHAHVYAQDEWGKQTLHYAIIGGNLEVVKYLIGEQYVNIHVGDDNGEAPVLFAANGGNVEIVKYLIEKGAYIDARNHRGYTCWYYAVTNGSLEIVKYLVEKMADINAATTFGVVPLYHAATVGNLEVVKYLIEKGARIDLRTNGETALNVLESKGHKDVVDSIVKKLTDRLIDAIKYDDLGEVQDLIDQGVSVDVRDSDARTLLHFAASNGNLELVKYLAETKGIDLNVKDRNGHMPLDLAARAGYSDIAKYLERKFYGERIQPRRYKRSHQHSSRRLLTTDSSNQPKITASNASEKSSWINDLVGPIVKLQESSAPSEAASSNHPIMHETWRRHEDGMRTNRVRHRHRRVQKRNVKYQDSHYYTDQPKIATSSGTRPSSWINGLLVWIKEKGGGLVSSVANKFAAKESDDSKSRGINACSVGVEKMYSATIPNTPQSRKSQGVPKGNIPNTSWSSCSFSREKVTSNVTDALEMNTIVLNNALILGDLAARLVNGTRYKQPIHENLLSPREKSMRFIDENMIMRTIQQGTEKFGGLDTNMDV